MKHTDSDLREVLRATVAVIEWQTLGIELGIDHSKLKIIANDNREKYKSCLTNMLATWLSSGSATWRGLVEAIRSPLVDKNDIAEEIARKHMMWV